MKTILSLLMVLNLGVSFSQNTDNSEYKINQTFDKIYLDNLKQSNPGLLDLYKAYCVKGYTITKFDSRFKNAEILFRIPLREKGTYMEITEFIANSGSIINNPLDYRFLPSQKDQFYKLGDTEYFLLIPSQQSLISK